MGRSCHSGEAHFGRSCIVSYPSSPCGAEARALGKAFCAPGWPEPPPSPQQTPGRAGQPGRAGRREPELCAPPLGLGQGLPRGPAATPRGGRGAAPGPLLQLPVPPSHSPGCGRSDCSFFRLWSAMKRRPSAGRRRSALSGPSGSSGPGRSG